MLIFKVDQLYLQHLMIDYNQQSSKSSLMVDQVSLKIV